MLHLLVRGNWFIRPQCCPPTALIYKFRSFGGPIWQPHPLGHCYRKCQEGR